MQEDVKPNVLKEPVENLKNVGQKRKIKEKTLKNVGNHPEIYIKCV